MSDINVNTTAVAKVIRLVTPLSGNTKPLSGNTKPLSGNTKPLSGNTKPLSGNTKPLSGNTKQYTIIDAASTNKTKKVELAKKVPKDQLAEAVTKLNDFIQKTQRNLKFRVDDKSGRVVVSVIDSQSHKVIRQIPNEEALKMARILHQSESLTLFNTKV